MITSISNQQMKYIVQLQKKAKFRFEQGVFVVEGIKMCLEAPKEWVVDMYVSDSFLGREEHKAYLAGYHYEIVAENIFLKISDTKTPQGILCIVKMPKYQIKDLLQGEKTHLLLLERIQDPGNLGTMIRTGEGAGITGVIMNNTTVDLFHPKTIRSTMGSIYRTPFLVTDDLTQTAKELKHAGVSLYATHLLGEVAYDCQNYRRPTGFLIGNEGNGLSHETAKLADSSIHIPMEGQVESLNAAVAAALLMYEVHRQRGSGDHFCSTPTHGAALKNLCSDI
ncbi:RNA methyltransferase [Lachnospiraceae bacterium ZAX-1]